MRFEVRKILGSPSWQVWDIYSNKPANSRVYDFWVDADEAVIQMNWAQRGVKINDQRS